MNKLLELFKQIFKFGIIGIICFILEYILYRIFKTFINLYIALFFSITITTIINYILSIKFVFKSKQTDKKKEFIVFVILSIIGLLLNELFMFIGMSIIYKYISNICTIEFAQNYLFKFISTGLVMVYNFISRKIFLEK